MEFETADEITIDKVRTGPKTDEYQYRKMPAVPKLIKDIDPENDIRVRIVGKILDKGFGFLVIDDGSAQKEIIADFDIEQEIGDTIRVFARVLPLEEGFELRAELVQDMNNLDVELYKKVVLGL